MEHLISDDFKGVISIEQNRKWIYKQAIGEANLSEGRPNRLETKFSIAGGSQVFTAVGILKLVEKKQLALGDRIGELLPYQLGQIDRSITIRQLLTHTSGIGDYYEGKATGTHALALRQQPNLAVPNAYLRSCRDYLPLFIHKPMQFKPGSRFSYSYAGYVLLSLVIEKISEMPFDVFMEKHIFEPAGMKDSGYYALDRLPASCATGYCYDKRSRQHYANIFSVEVKGSGAGGAFTTTADLEKFWLALKEGVLLAKPFVRDMLSPQVEEGFYGYGVWLQEQSEDDEYLPFIQGSQPGISFISSFDRLKGRSITLISNFASDVLSLHGQLYSLLEQERAI